MIDKVKPINNPLTIIAIFAALAEIASTVSLKLISPELQKFFIWFVMGFPLLIVITFFRILIKQPNVLYGPGDYRDDQSFITAIGIRNIITLEEADKQIDIAKKEIAKIAETIPEKEKKSLKEVVDKNLNPVKSNIDSSKKENYQMVFHYGQTLTDHCVDKYNILLLMYEGKLEQVSNIDLIELLPRKMDHRLALKHIRELIREGYLVLSKEGISLNPDLKSMRKDQINRLVKKLIEASENQSADEIENRAKELYDNP
jgi:hypothetical protein